MVGTAAERVPIAGRLVGAAPVDRSGAGGDGAAAALLGARLQRRGARGKPSPDVYAEAARRLGVDPARCIAVEDSSNGIRAAAAAGMAVVAIPNPTYPPRPDALARCAKIAPTPEAVRNYLVERLPAPATAVGVADGSSPAG
jgi:beta-phosphoglucomutase-like phosphatase (HAD superfamily)